MCFAATGIHPSEAHLAQKDAVAEIEQLSQSSPQVVAIGEIGLDFYWDKTPPQGAICDVWKDASPGGKTTYAGSYS